MCTSERTASTSNPIAAICASRLGRVCSRETYKPFASRCRAFAWRIAYVRVDFIVPGNPEMSTTCPTGKPPPRTSSRPSMNVGIFFVTIALPPASAGQRHAARSAESVELPVEIGVEPKPEHLGQGEPPDAVDRVALVVPHRAHASVRAEVANLRMDRVLVSRERRVRRREEPALVDRFRVRLARHFRVGSRLELREVYQEGLPEAFLLYRAQEERGVPEGLCRAQHPVHEEVQEPLKAFLSRGHRHLPGIRSCRTVPQDLLHLLRRSLHRQEDEPEIRVVVHEGH